MAIPENPYIAGDPVGNTHGFVGREDILREVMRALHSNRSIVLYGQRRIGKTSILQYIKTYLDRTTNYTPIYYDLQDKADWSLAPLLVDLSETIADNLKISIPNLGDNPEAYFLETWLPAILKIYDNHTIILLFDEFDTIAKPTQGQAVNDFFSYLRQLMVLDSKKLGFVFILGRNMTDLSSAALSVFRTMPFKRISLLSHSETEDLIKLSDQNRSLVWSQDAMDTIWEYTHGHPYFTQAVCAHIWGDLHKKVRGDKLVTVNRESVEKAIPETLETSKYMLEWLWAGLSPAQKVMAAVIAQSGALSVDEEKLESILLAGGMRIGIRELQDAPKTLQDWDILEETSSGYSFRVQLLHRWIVENKSLRRVQDELNRNRPPTEALYQSGNLSDDIISFVEFSLDFDIDELSADFLNSFKEAIAIELEVQTEDVIFLGFRPGSIGLLVAIKHYAVKIPENIQSKLSPFKIKEYLTWENFPDKLTFISYARKDRLLIEAVYYFLKLENMAPWMDVHDISPGQDWDYQILKALSSSTGFIFCLSSNSIESLEKRAVLFNELETAKEKASQFGPDSIFLIPLLFDDIEIPDSIGQYQALIWDADKQQLVNGLREGLKQRKRMN
jgi:hypothetical protein